MILRLVLTVALACLMSWWLCEIDPAAEYTWYSGIWHGLFFVGNFIRSWFTDALYKAELYTTGYNICHWIWSIFAVIGVLFGGSKKN